MLYHESVGRVQNKECYFIFLILFWHFLFVLFLSKNFLFLLFSFPFSFSRFPQRNINQLETGILISNVQWNLCILQTNAYCTKMFSTLSTARCPAKKYIQLGRSMTNIFFQQKLSNIYIYIYIYIFNISMSVILLINCIF